jgi:hypothetical protein
LDTVSEDWNLFNTMVTNYENKIKNISVDNADNLQSGAREAAFIYYSSDAELQKYFDDAPFQEEYAPYRQIFFINNDLQAKSENPLNALRHSENNLTGKIDLENPFYKIREFHGEGKNGIKIKIINSKNQTLYNKDKVFKKEELTIIYSKKYHNKKIVGNLNNENIRKYLIVDENSKKIDVIKDIIWEDEEIDTKIITFKVTDRKGININDAVIIYKTDFQEERQTTENSITFKGDEIGYDWQFLAKKDSENLFSDTISVIPDTQTGEISLVLHEVIEVQLSAYDPNSGKNISNFKFSINGQTYKANENSSLTFKDDNIKKTFTIEITKKEADFTYCNKIEYCAATSDKNLKIPLQKKFHQRYKIDAGEHGKKICKSEYSNDEKGSDLGDNAIKPFNGWIFTGFELSNVKTGDYDGVLIAKYEKSLFGTIKTFFSKPIAYIGLIVCVIGICIFIAAFLKTNKQKQLKTKIENYVQGAEIVLETLKTYKLDWEKQKPEIKKEGGSWLSILKIGSKEIKFDSTDYKKWLETAHKIENAFDKLEQDFIKNDSISSETLEQTDIEEKPKEEKPENNQEQKKEPVTQKPSEQTEQQVVQDQNSSQKNQSSEQRQQEEFQSAFWELMKKSDKPQKSDYDNWFKKGSSISAENEYKKFYDKYLDTSAKFEKFTEIPAIDRIKAKTLNDLENLINK